MPYSTVPSPSRVLGASGTAKTKSEASKTHASGCAQGCTRGFGDGLRPLRMVLGGRRL